MPLPEQYHIVDGVVEDIKHLHPLENSHDKTVFIERFKALFGDDLKYEDISNGEGRLFRISYQGYEYNIYIEAFDSGGGREKKKKIGIPQTKGNKREYGFKKLIDNYESVLVINEYVPFVRDENGELQLSDRSVYGIIKPSEIYSSKVIREKTGNASSRWVWFEDMLTALSEDRMVENRKKNVYIIPSDKLKAFFDLKLIEEEYSEMAKYLYSELNDDKSSEENKAKVEQSITRLFRNNLIKTRKKKVGINHEVNCTCEFCNCNVNIPELLVASHINAKANIRNDKTLSDDEKFRLMTDVNNGFLLCRTHDALFDKKFVTLDDDGRLIISDEVKNLEKEFNIEDLENRIVIKDISDETKEYLKQHRMDFQSKQEKLKKA